MLARSLRHHSTYNFITGLSVTFKKVYGGGSQNHHHNACSYTIMGKLGTCLGGWVAKGGGWVADKSHLGFY